MSPQEFENLFDLICDKVGSDYFGEAEKEQFANLAQYSIIDNLLFPARRNQEKKDNDVFEFAYQNSMVQGLSPLHCIVTAAIDTSQTVTFANLTGLLLADYGIVAEPYRIINLVLPLDSLTDPLPRYNAKFVGTQKGSDSIYKNLRFGKNTDPRYATYTVRQEAGAANGKEIWWSSPLLAADEVQVEFIRTPVPFDIGEGQGFEVDAIFHNEILFRALQLAGIAIREGEFYEMTNIEQAKEA